MGDGITLASESLQRPDWRIGLEIFASRSLSLISALILGVVVCVASFMLLTFTAIAGYYYAVRQSKREEYFIDLPNISRTTTLVLEGVGRYFVQSYVLGLMGLLTAAILYIAPVLPWAIGGEGWMYASLGLMILWLPSFFLAGAVVFHGYPYLIATNDGVGALRYAFSTSRARPLLALARGFMLLYPIPGWIIHFLMAIYYPMIVSWAVAATADTDEAERAVPEEARFILRGVGLGLLLAAAMVGACYLLVGLWETPGFIAWLVLCFVVVLAARPWLARR